MAIVGLSTQDLQRQVALTLGGTPALNTVDTYVADGVSFRWNGTTLTTQVNNVWVPVEYNPSTQGYRAAGAPLTIGGGAGPANTDGLPEGTANLYHTAARVNTLADNRIAVAQAALDTPVTVSASRALTNADNGKRLQLTADGLTLTQPNTLAAGFGCMIMGPTSGAGTLARTGVTGRDGLSTSIPIPALGIVVIDPTVSTTIFNYIIR